MKRLSPPSLHHGPVLMPLTSVSVSPRDGDLMVGFNGDGCGHAHIISLAEAEALGDRLLDWVEYLRFEATFPSKKANV